VSVDLEVSAAPDAAAQRSSAAKSPSRYFEDFSVGLRFSSPAPIAVTAERIKSFASEFDPQPSHLDEDRARGSMLGELVASGWHTAAVTMRLIVDSDLGLCGKGAGIAIESMRWHRPVRPGDSLRMDGTVIETRPSRSRADKGVVKFRAVAYNQMDEVVLDATHVIMVSRRGSAGSP
jgi:acyl dehydratase